MRKLVYLAAALGLLAWSAPASAVVGETTIKVADGAAPVPQATVVVTFKSQAGTRIRTVRRTTPRSGTRKVVIPDRTATVDISVTTASGRTETRAGIDVALLVNRSITIDIPGGAAPPAPGSASPVMPPPLQGPEGTLFGLGLGGQSTACNNWSTIGLESLGVPDPIGEDPNACFSSAFRGSVYIGTSWRVGSSWLAGVEADLGLTNSSKTVNGIPGTVGGIPGLTAAAAANDSVTVKKTWDASFRGRFGYYVTPQTVIYGTGGFALQHIEATVNCTAAGACGLAVAPFTASNSKTLLGWTLGAGVEVALTDRIVVRGEYRYADYGSFTSTYGTAANIAVTSDIDLRTHTALLGIGFRLGGGP
jgi:outer membrane immunogenic protein